MSRSALVAGASGLVGGQVVRLLLADDAYDQVTVLVRAELALAHRKLTQRVVDFDRLEEFSDVPRVNDVFGCLGTTLRRAGSQEAFRKVDFTYVVALARLASRNRAGHFLLVTALGADPQSRIFYNRVKGEVEQAVRREAFDGLSIFRPSLLLGERAERRPGERVAVVLSPMISWAMIGPLRKYRPIPAATVAGAMVQIAREAPRGVHVYESDDIADLCRASFVRDYTR